MADNVTINSRYLTYDKNQVQEILEQVEHLDDAPTAESENVVKSGGVAAALGGYFNKEEDVATEEEIRDIVREYTHESDDSDSSSSDSE